MIGSKSMSVSNLDTISKGTTFQIVLPFVMFECILFHLLSLISGEPTPQCFYFSDDGSDSRGQVSVSIWFEVDTCEQAQPVHLSSCTPPISRTSVRFD